MARTIIRCRYTGHYIIGSHDGGASPSLSSGRIFCPYCAAEHVWNCTEASGSEDDPQRPAARRRPLVRQAS
jgi:hypothetical protein